MERFSIFAHKAPQKHPASLCFSHIERYFSPNVRLLAHVFLHQFGRNHLLVKCVCTSLRRLEHLDDLRVRTTILVLEGSDGFLCHSLNLFNLLVHSHALQDWVILLQLQTVWSVLAVLCSDVS